MLKVVGNVSDQVSKGAGSPLIVSLSVCSLGVFLVIGPVFRFSTEYQLVANTFMSAVSYLMLFVLQHTQNRETNVLHLKLDAALQELRADGRFVGCEDLSEKEIEELVFLVRSKRSD